MTMRDVVPLHEGAVVAHDDENWVIVHVEDASRVLAARLSDGRHEFLAIAGLKPSIPKAGEESSELSIEDGIAAKPTSSHLSRILNRRIRSARGGKAPSLKEQEQAQATINEYQRAMAVLRAPRAARRALIREMCKEFGYAEATAYRRIQIVTIHGTADALSRAVSSRSGQCTLSPEVQEAIQTYLAKYRFVATPKTLPDILELLNGHLRRKQLKEVSLSTLWKAEKEIPLKKKLEAQGRKKQAKDAFRPKVGHLPNNDYPLAIVQVDHTPTQVCLVDEQDRQPIGDAWLTLVIDTYSRMVLGFYLTFDPPSTLSTGLALAHAFLPKEEYLRSVGVSGEWPCWGFPDVVHVDNGAELNGQMMHGARKRYRFTIRDRPVGEPNFGGHVESAFRTFMYELKSMPGTKFSNPTERAEYDSEGRAIFTIREFERYFTEFLVNDYHCGKHTGEGMETAPILKWEQGIFLGDKMPPTGLPARPSDPLSLRITLMPFKHRTVRNGIVSLFDEKYHSGALTLISDDVDLTKPRSEREFEVRYDPRDISRIWFYDDQNDDYIPLDFADLSKGSISLWEHRARKRRRGDPTAQFKDQRYESKLRREEMKEDAAKKTKQQRLESEKALHRAEGALAQVQKPPVRLTPKQPKNESIDADALQKMRARVRGAPPISTTKQEAENDT